MGKKYHSLYLKKNSKSITNKEWAQNTLLSSRNVVSLMFIHKYEICLSTLFSKWYIYIYVKSIMREWNAEMS